MKKVLANLCKDSIGKSPNLLWSNPRWARSFVAERFWRLSTKKLDTPKEKIKGSRQWQIKNTMMSFRLSAQNADTLNNLAKELHISKSSIVNDLLDNHLQNIKHQKKLKFILDDNVNSYKGNISCQKQLSYNIYVFAYIGWIIEIYLRIWYLPKKFITFKFIPIMI